MKHINQIKLSLAIGVFIILIPLLGFPQGVKTFLLVTAGAILIYFNVVALHAERMQRPKKAAPNRKTHTFVESKPQTPTPEIISGENGKT